MTVDFTFACIGGVDAMQTVLYVTLNLNKKKAIVVTTDLAKYDLNSTGEYTQESWSTCYAHHQSSIIALKIGKQVPKVF
jgi:3-hydroxy-3-methylglutaryl CoA synthase